MTPLTPDELLSLVRHMPESMYLGIKQMIDELAAALVENNALRQELAKERLKAERLQVVLDCRPALNAGLYDAYIRWSAQVGEMEFLRAVCAEN